MSSGKSAVGAVNVQRKTWDKEKFAARAKDRADGIVVEEEKAGPAPYRAAPSGLAGPAGSERAYLPSREVDLKLDEKLGKKRVRGPLRVKRHVFLMIVLHLRSWSPMRPQCHKLEVTFATYVNVL